MQPAINIQVNDEQLNQLFKSVGARFAKKPVLATLRKGATQIKSELRKALPGNLKKFKAIITAKALRGDAPALNVGFSGRKVYYRNRSGQQYDAYMLVHWHNYGTLSNRSRSHAFTKGRRSISARWKGGIKPGGFVERGMEAGLPKAEKKITEEFNNEVDKWARKYGFR